MYIPETFFATNPETNEENVLNLAGVPAARTSLKCSFCRLTQGACFQCSEKKCVRAYHATCAAPGGVLVENVLNTSEPDENGNTTQSTELTFSCRFHRPKRPKDHDRETLEQNAAVKEFAEKLTPGDIIQCQLYLGDIFAGRVLENRISEQTLLLQVIPSKETFEVEYKYVLCSAGLKTSPSPKISRTRVSMSNVRGESKGKRVAIEPKKTDFYADTPTVGDQFLPETASFTWQEFIRQNVDQNPFQEPAIKIWYYVGEKSTENNPAWTKDPDVRVADKEAFEPHLQRRTGNAESGACYMTQAEEKARLQAIAAQSQQAYYPPQQTTGSNKSVPSPQHTANWRQPATPQPTGPIASTSSGQKFVIASHKSSGGSKRVSMSLVHPSPYQGYQTPHRVSYTGTNGARINNNAASGNKASQSTKSTPASTPNATPSRSVATPHSTATGTPVPKPPPNVTVPPAPLSGATPS
ncbi:hypothetical protein ABW19_dt0205516 [Dactylella cylindrospora]|nr:hypothetical protein ABW19_dt0205516 [Dactylella cylindrospora]